MNELENIIIDIAEPKYLYNKLKNDAKNAINNIKPIIINGEDRNCKGNSRFIIYDINTILDELLTLLESTDQKMEKRFYRIKFLIDLCSKQNCSVLINKDIKERFKRIENRFIEIQNKINNKSIYNMIQQFNPFTKGNIIKEEPSLYILKLELGKDLDNLESDFSINIGSTSLIFEQINNEINNNFKNKKNNINKFKKPQKSLEFFPGEIKNFNDHCKNILNNDGMVYDICSYIAIIALKEIIDYKAQSTSPIYDILLNSAQLVFKGGASIGKFILLDNKDLWNKLSNEEQRFAYHNFIKGGDNDTTIKFNKDKLKQFLQTNNNYTIYDINKEIQKFIFVLSSILQHLIEKYKIKDIIKQYIVNINNSIYTYANNDFIFSDKTSKSYAIIEDKTDSDYLRKIDFNFNYIPNQIYNSSSYVEFVNKNNQNFKFYLTRIKCGFLTEQLIPNALLINNENNRIEKIKANCYAECLDISIECIDSAQFLKTYCYVDIDLNNSNFFFDN